MDVIVNTTDASSHETELTEPMGSCFGEHVLLALGFDAKKPPLAKLFSTLNGLTGKWVVASPVYCEAGHNDAMVKAYGNALELTDTASRIWLTELSPLLSHQGQSPVFVDAHHWLVPANHLPALCSEPPSVIVHQSLMPLLKAMDDTLLWQKLFTEMQMALGFHPLNTRLNAQTLINGLWFWGADDMDVSTIRPVYTDDMQWSRVFPHALPIDAMTDKSPANALILLTHARAEDIQIITTLTKRQDVTWYWKNTVYRQKKRSWWSWFTRR